MGEVDKARERMDKKRTPEFSGNVHVWNPDDILIRKLEPAIYFDENVWVIQIGSQYNLYIHGEDAKNAIIKSLWEKS